MTNPTSSGRYYRRKLPHFRIPGAIYHIRLSLGAGTGFLLSDNEYQIIQDSIFFTHEQRRCYVHCYVIMPNHSHLAVQPRAQIRMPEASSDYRDYQKIEEIIGSVKKYTARKINKLRGHTGSLWQEENFDRIVRSDRDLETLVEYLHGNPVRWGLVQRPEDYRWSSASTIYSGSEEYRYWFA